MRLCLIGKYPPIQGGVSAQTYWLARGLALRGHQVHVVTNADDVEGAFRLSLGADDWPWYQPAHADSGGSVTVYNPEPFTPRTMMHIPASDPFVTKLASLATDVIRRSDCEVILSSYYEPYGVAGWMASKWAGRPLAVKHAGSDLDRLCAVPDLATAYKEILRSADAVVTQARLTPRFLGMGVEAERIETDVAFAPPRDVFHRGATPLDMGSFARLDGALGAFDPSLPTIGTYGKIGQTKGTFDLIAALGRLAREGRRVQLVAMVGDTGGAAIRPFLRDAGLADRSWILPFLPNWKVPAFINACTAVCFLERDFPIPIHGPVVPREVLSCGRCLVVSNEIAEKQAYRDKLVTGDNVIVVKDPKDHDELTAALRDVVTNQPRALAIGKRGWQLSKEFASYDAFIDGWERLLQRCIDRRSAAPDRAQAAPARALASLEATVPTLVSFVRARDTRLLDGFLATANRGGPFEIGIALCHYLRANVDSASTSDDAEILLEALRYLEARLMAAHEPRSDHAAAFPVTDRLQGKVVSAETAGHLRPVRSHSMRIETFNHDVSGVFPPLPPGSPAPAPPEPLQSLPREPLFVLFLRSPNLVMRELRVDAATVDLVNRCDGTATATELADALCRDFGVDEEGRADLSARVFDALDRLHRARAIVFGEQKPGWGWTGGAR